MNVLYNEPQSLTATQQVGFSFRFLNNTSALFEITFRLV